MAEMGSLSSDGAVSPPLSDSEEIATYVIGFVAMALSIASYGYVMLHVPNTPEKAPYRKRLEYELMTQVSATSRAAKFKAAPQQRHPRLPGSLLSASWNSLAATIEWYPPVSTACCVARLVALLRALTITSADDHYF